MEKDFMFASLSMLKTGMAENSHRISIDRGKINLLNTKVEHI